MLENETSQENFFSGLPPEIVAYICQHLDPQDIGNTRLVSQIFANKIPLIQLALAKLQVKSIVSGVSNGITFFQLECGFVFACGENNQGQLGLGRLNKFVLAPTKIPNLSNVKSIASGPLYTMFLLVNGQAFACGANLFGNLGLGYRCQQSMVNPTQITSLPTVKSIVCDNANTIFLLEDGRVFVRDLYNKLGLGNEDKLIPTLVPSLSNVKSITAGYGYTFFLLEDGHVVARGKNNYGNLGLGHIGKQGTPTQIPGLSNVKSIVASGEHTFFLLNDGRIFACGLNNYGQLGLGHTDNQVTPTLVPSLSNVKSITAGSSYTFFLLEDGRIFACGGNDYGQLGLGHQQAVTTGPTEVNHPYKSVIDRLRARLEKAKQIERASLVAPAPPKCLR